MLSFTPYSVQHYRYTLHPLTCLTSDKDAGSDLADKEGAYFAVTKNTFYTMLEIISMISGSLCNRITDVLILFRLYLQILN